jgi:phage terminase large subunit
MAKQLNPAIFNDWVYNGIDDYSHRIEVYYGGAGSGKSYGGTQKIYLKALKSKRKVLVIRKIQRTIKDSIFSVMLTHLHSSGLYDLCRVSRSDLEIELPNGSIFLFKGLDDPEKIKSIDGITDIVIEEGTELTEDDFTQLNLRLRALVDDLQIYIFFNPISKKNWVYDYFFVRELPLNVKIIKTTYLDNKFLSEEYRQELERLKDRNPAYYRIYCLGEFATLDKLVFPTYTTKVIGENEIKGLPRWIGCDWGYVNDPSALVWGHIDTINKKIYVCGEYVKKGMLNNEIAETMINLGLHKDKSYGDSAEPKTIAELKRYGINIEATVKGKDSVIHGIQWIQQYELVIDNRCFKVIEELDNYTWQKDKKTGEYINEPVDTFNHTIDAIRYGLNKYIKGNITPKVMVKPKGL